jgi:uncharacterized protein YegP (UPF0339 family)
MIVCLELLRFHAGQRRPRLKFEILRNAQGQYYWHMVAANGRIIAYSGETYVSKADCQHALNLVRSSAAAANVIDRT